jgi:hypothetical protein
MSKNSDKGEPQDNGMAESPIHMGRARMAPKPDAPAGQEQDAQGNVIPFSQRTKDDQEKALGNSRKS